MTGAYERALLGQERALRWYEEANRIARLTRDFAELTAPYQRAFDMLGQSYLQSDFVRELQRIGELARTVEYRMAPLSLVNPTWEALHQLSATWSHSSGIAAAFTAFDRHDSITEALSRLSSGWVIPQISSGLVQRLELQQLAEISGSALSQYMADYPVDDLEVEETPDVIAGAIAAIWRAIYDYIVVKGGPGPFAADLASQVVVGLLVSQLAVSIQGSDVEALREEVKALTHATLESEGYRVRQRFVTVDSVSIRIEPIAGSPLIRKIGVDVEVVEIGQEGGWLYVRLDDLDEDPTYGWVYRRNLRPIDPALKLDSPGPEEDDPDHDSGVSRSSISDDA